MSKAASNHESATWLSDLRGLSQLSTDGALGIADVVESLHATIQAMDAPLGSARQHRTRGITGLVYRAVRTGIAITGTGISATLRPLQAAIPNVANPVIRDRLVSVLNGTHGDHLAQTGNPLAIAMALRHGGSAIDLAAPQAFLAQRLGRQPRQTLIVCIHGLCMNDRQWQRDGYSHGEFLATSLNADALYLHYNSGLPIHANGAALSMQLEALMQSWVGCAPELVLIGHSMGGLVARSACHQAHCKQHLWLQQLKHMVFLGTPHHGAPLERGGAVVDLILGISPYAAPFAKLGASRSAGIQDLRHGKLVENTRASPVALPKHVRCYALAAKLDPSGTAPVDAFVGDGLVPLASALGTHANPAQDLGIPKSRQRVISNLGHLALLWQPDVGKVLQRWLQPKS